jgi:hypothetical protein
MWWISTFFDHRQSTMLLIFLSWPQTKYHVTDVVSQYLLWHKEGQVPKCKTRTPSHTHTKEKGKGKRERPVLISSFFPNLLTKLLSSPTTKDKSNDWKFQESSGRKFWWKSITNGFISQYPVQCHHQWIRDRECHITSLKLQIKMHSNLARSHNLTYLFSSSYQSSNSTQ